VQGPSGLSLNLVPPLLLAAADPTQDSSGISVDLDVVSRRLDVARQEIQPSLGATVYNFSPQALETIPQGENAPLNQVLLQAPGVAQDSFGQIHLRGEHANAPTCSIGSTVSNCRKDYRCLARR
jgi:hypothetical protein